MRPATFVLSAALLITLGLAHHFFFLYSEASSELEILERKVAQLTAERNRLLTAQQVQAISDLGFVAAPPFSMAPTLAPIPQRGVSGFVQALLDRPAPVSLPPALENRFRPNDRPERPAKQATQWVAPTVSEFGSRVPVLVIAYQRANYLQKTLESIHRYIDTKRNFVIVSQDGYNQAVSDVVRFWPNVRHLQHDNTGPIKFRSTNAWEKETYYRIAQHYAWALKQVFADSSIQEVILLEEDLEIAPDFFDYMRAMSQLLDRDETLWIASAWNDNGYAEFSSDSKRLFRTDFFPGLGWLLKRRIWEEFPNFTDAYWDDWLREPAQRKGRSCIRPEVSRTLTFGKDGASLGQFYDTHLARIRLNQDAVNWPAQDLTYLVKATYDSYFLPQVRSADVVPSTTSQHDLPKDRHSRMVYTSMPQFQQIAQQLRIMDDEKAGIPRTAYYGVVTLRVGPDSFLHIAPQGL